MLLLVLVESTKPKTMRSQPRVVPAGGDKQIRSLGNAATDQDSFSPTKPIRDLRTSLQTVDAWLTPARLTFAFFTRKCVRCDVWHGGPVLPCNSRNGGQPEASQRKVIRATPHQHVVSRFLFTTTFFSVLQRPLDL